MTPTRDAVERAAQALFDRECARCVARGNEPHHKPGTLVKNMPPSYRDDYEKDARAMLAAALPRIGAPGREEIVRALKNSTCTSLDGTYVSAPTSHVADAILSLHSSPSQESGEVVAALQFYADPRNYCDLKPEVEEGVPIGPPISSITYDGGQRARAAISRASQAQPGGVGAMEQRARQIIDCENKLAAGDPPGDIQLHAMRVLRVGTAKQILGEEDFAVLSPTPQAGGLREGREQIIEQCAKIVDDVAASSAGVERKLTARAIAKKIRTLSSPAQAAVQVGWPPEYNRYIPDIVKNAMLTAWNEICSDTGNHPTDIEHNFEGRKGHLGFTPSHWAALTGTFVAETLKRASTPAPRGERWQPIEAALIIEMRDALVEGRTDDAYHMLRMFVDADCKVALANGNNHWAEIEAAAAKFAAPPPPLVAETKG